MGGATVGAMRVDTSDAYSGTVTESERIASHRRWRWPSTSRWRVALRDAPLSKRDEGQIGRAHVELQSHSDLVCRLLLEKKKHAGTGVALLLAFRVGVIDYAGITVRASDLTLLLLLLLIPISLTLFGSSFIFL